MQVRKHPALRARAWVLGIGLAGAVTACAGSGGAPGSAGPEAGADAADLPAGEAALYREGGEIRFTRGHEARDIPFELNSGKIYVSVRLNGQGPFSMVFDTGSPGMVLDTRTVSRLGLSLGPAAPTTGAGENPFPIAPVEGAIDAALPGVSLLGQTAAAGPLDEIVGPYEGRPLEGLLGCFNLLTRFIVEIDYERQVLHLTDPSEYELPPGGLIVPVNPDYGHPFTEGSLLPMEGEAVTGTYMIDTGMRGTLFMTTPYVNAHGLLDRCGPTIYTTVGGGIGGQVFCLVGRTRSFTFGEVTVEAPHITLTQVSEGLMAEEGGAGIIGSKILQRFHVVFDYPGRRLVLFPRKRVDLDLLDFDKSGLFLIEDRAEGVVRVIDRVVGSPAAGAGVQVGDALHRVNGEPVRDLGLEQVRRILRGPAGTPIVLEVGDGSGSRTVRFRLRPQV